MIGTLSLSKSDQSSVLPKIISDPAVSSASTISLRIFSQSLIVPESSICCRNLIIPNTAKPFSSKLVEN